MLIQIAMGVIALATVVLVAFLIPAWIQLRKTAEEAERLLRNMNQDLPALLREATETAVKLNKVAGELREAAASARVLGDAVGGIGETINNVRGAVRNGAGTLLSNVGSLVAGFRAAYGVFKQKSSSESHHQQGGSSNGG